jgi:AcrR family transcriptional regulator
MRKKPNMPDQGSSQERMIAAAVCLFAHAGFNGTTTKDVAKLAKVSEGNIFRYFPTKQDLFLAALESELQKLSIRAEALVLVAEAADFHAALEAVFEIITETMVKQPELVRLLHFSLLEHRPDIKPALRRYLRPIGELVVKKLRSWPCDSDSCDAYPSIGVLSFIATIATVTLLQDSFSELHGSSRPFESVESAAAVAAKLWSRVLSPKTTQS